MDFNKTYVGCVPKIISGIILLIILLANGAVAVDSYEFVLKIPSSQQWFFNGLSGIAVDSSGNVYVVDKGNNRIQKYSSSGTFISKWGSYGTSDGQFYNPSVIAVDSNGNAYVADKGNNRIQKYSSSGTFLSKWESSGTGDGQFYNPMGIAVDNSGNIYVADMGNNRIQKFDSSGTFLSKWGSYGSGDGQFYNPMGIAVDNNGNVYVADTNNNRIQKFDSSGNFLTKWGSIGFGYGQFISPRVIAVDSSGNVYVADSSIQKFDSSGGFLDKWKNYVDDIQLDFYAEGIAVDNNGNVYVADTNNNRILKFNSSGGFLDKWGSSGNSDGQFSYPDRIAVDSGGNVYVADTGNNRIQKFKNSAIVGRLVADAGPEAITVFSGETVQFSGANSYDNTGGTIVKYYWDFGDGVELEGKNVNHRFRGSPGTETYTNSKVYTVTLTVENNLGVRSSTIVAVRVNELTKTATVIIPDNWEIPIPGTPISEKFARVTANYNWVGFDNINNKDIYIVKKLMMDTKGFSGSFELSLWNYENMIPSYIWNDQGIVIGTTSNLYGPFFYNHLGLGAPTKELHYEGAVFKGIEVSGLYIIQIGAYGLKEGNYIGGDPVSAAISLSRGLFFGVDSFAFMPDYSEKIELPPSGFNYNLVHLASPGELRVYNAEGDVTGLIDGVIKEEIPLSLYDNENKIVIVFNNIGNIENERYEVKGTDTGTYGLDIISVNGGTTTTFIAVDIPTTTGQIHQYVIDWNALSNGEKGVTIEIDSEGDGIFERTINAGQTLTDITPPQITINVPANGAEYILNQNMLANWSAMDLESGIASATGTKQSGEAIDTSTIGTKTFTVDAVDNAGNPTTKTVTYHVSYNFAGFFQPIDNLPLWNSVKGGNAVPVKFSLSGDQGLNIFPAGYPKSQKIDCDSTALIDEINETVTAGQSSLSYDAVKDQYNYVWKTENTWTGTCRQIIVRLNDGIDHMANFKFK